MSNNRTRLSSLWNVNVLHLCSAICIASEALFVNVHIALLSGALAAVQAGFRTRHITTVAIAVVCRNATHWAKLHAKWLSVAHQTNTIVKMPPKSIFMESHKKTKKTGGPRSTQVLQHGLMVKTSPLTMAARIRIQLQEQLLNIQLCNGR